MYGCLFWGLGLFLVVFTPCMNSKQDEVWLMHVRLSWCTDSQSHEMYGFKVKKDVRVRECVLACTGVG